jgi:hypothetical protein
MERTGPESLMLMAAAPIAYRAGRGDVALWELPVQDDREEPALLAALPLGGAGPRRGGLRGWIDRLRPSHPAALVREF